MRLVVRLALVALVLLLIPACQTGEEIVDPALNAVPTRTLYHVADCAQNVYTCAVVVCDLPQHRK
ncbi:MAG: hypothetical protein K8S97_01090 [Anaerolineae bacterium]|nr:hypothetical protein [Anaerolineae bacterium]